MDALPGARELPDAVPPVGPERTLLYRTVRAHFETSLALARAGPAKS